MKDFFFLVVGLVVIIGSVFLYLERSLVVQSDIKTIRLNDVSIDVEISDTDLTRNRGLSGRESLPDGSGMLFIFDKPDKYGFWMKDMNFAIDIVWIDDDLRIVGIEKSVTPETFPQIFLPNQPIKYVLELPAGFSDTQGIDIGEIMYLEY